MTLNAPSDRPVATRAPHPYADTCVAFEPAPGKRGLLYSLPALGRHLGRDLQRLPLSIRIVLESLLRHCDGKRVLSEQVAQLAAWQPVAPRSAEIPFVVARVVLQDFTGVPLLADLAAMRHAAQLLGKPASAIEPLVPVDLVVDHSVMIDHWGDQQALDLNMALEFQRNRERYGFMKWGMQAFGSFGVVPPGFGIVHQVNLEYLARGVHRTDKARGAIQLYYPDTLVGTDSHTTMINGIGVVGWGVGGIEAEAAMLGQPVTLLTPDVVGFELTGRLREGVTATDLVLTVTETLRQHKVVGKFVEFFGEGTRTLALPDRATVANMAPEYGATMGFFPVDEKTIAYFEGTGRTRAEIELFEAYFRAQGLFGVPAPGEIDYSQVVRLDLGDVTPSLAGPKRPQDRIELGKVASQFRSLFSQPVTENGFNQPPERLGMRFEPASAGSMGLLAGASKGTDNVEAPPGAPRDLAEMVGNRPVLEADASVAIAIASNAKAVPQAGLQIGNGDILIAAITSCTNT
ncbi:MAG: aconitase family protein, partial [Aquabacterium sp.]|nr:aconitase family protein [Aquabacterium sp.]